MVNHVYLSTQSKTLSITYKPVSLSIVSRYLKDSILPGKNDHEIEINRFSNHQYDSFNTFGAARLEILFYEKRSLETGREQITLYGIAENIHFQVQSFTLFCDTCWFDNGNHHPEDRYFDSIIIELFGSSPIICGSSLELSLRGRDGELTARSSIVLQFSTVLKNRDSPALSRYRRRSKVNDCRSASEPETAAG